MRCSKCEFDNPAGMKFCGKCRAALGLTCPNCSFENPPGFDFCGQCAAALHSDTGFTKGKPPAGEAAGGVRIALEQQTSEALEGERKTVTALFADIKGSTELMEDLDPEEARAIVDPALKLMIDAARRYEGYVVQSTGDGVFALFGAPVAHEDHPLRALHAALRMQDEVRRYADRQRAEGRAPLQIRIGGEYRRGSRAFDCNRDGKSEYTPIGHTANH
jgi:class 3 adenylate cyclase